MTSQTVSFRAPVEKIAKLDVLAIASQRDRTFLLNEAIDQYLELQEHHDQLTLQALADVDAGRTVPHEEVRAWAQSLATDHPLSLPEDRRKA